MGISWSISKDEAIHRLIETIKDASTSPKKRDFAFTDLLNLVQPQVRSQIDRYCRRPNHDRSQAESVASQAIWEAVNYFDPAQGIFSHLIARFLQRRLITFLQNALIPDRAGFRTVSIDHHHCGTDDDHHQDRLGYMADPDAEDAERQHDERDDFLKCWRQLAPRLTDIERIAILEVYGRGLSFIEAAKQLPPSTHRLQQKPLPAKRIDNAIMRAKLKARDLGFDFDKITAKKSS
jgi:DNA-directed RNA polymerase specialized sigma24 family protein